MYGSESATFIVEITLGTEEGELPDDNEVEELVANQMAGELDEDTGLFTMAVILVERVVDE